MNLLGYHTMRVRTDIGYNDKEIVQFNKDKDMDGSRILRIIRQLGRFSKNPVLRQLEMADRDLSNLQMKLAEELENLSREKGMPVTQENGQRRLGPPLDYSGKIPVKGSEVFVGKLPRNCYEPEIFSMFEKFGKIYEIRMMMDFSGSNRGYCFVHYYNPMDAAKAIKGLNNFELRPGKRIGVVKSVDNCRLFIGGIPKDKNKVEIFEEINRITEGVVRVISYPDQHDTRKNRGFAFVEYESHKCAAMARRKMIPGRIQMFDTDVQCDWADPEPDVDNLHVRNLSVNTTERGLSELFNLHSENGVIKVKKIRDYAFVNFKSREQAEAAKHALQDIELDGSLIEINWAKPPGRPNRSTRKALAREERRVALEEKRFRRIFGSYGAMNMNQVYMQNSSNSFEQNSRFSPHGPPNNRNVNTSTPIWNQNKSQDWRRQEPSPLQISGFNFDGDKAKSMPMTYSDFFSPGYIPGNEPLNGFFSPILGHPSPFLPSNALGRIRSQFSEMNGVGGDSIFGRSGESCGWTAYTPQTREMESSPNGYGMSLGMSGFNNFQIRPQSN